MWWVERVGALMSACVSVMSACAVCLGAVLKLGMDTIVEPFAQLLGNTTVGENCRIRACSIIQDSALGEDVQIGAFTLVNTSTLERGASAGPYAACVWTITSRPSPTSATSGNCTR